MRYASPRRLTRYQIAAALATAFAINAAAQTTPDTQLRIVEIVAAAPLAGLGIERDHLPFQVQTVSSDALKKAHSGNLTEFLTERLTGVNVNNIQGSPFQTDLTYRGFRASPILGSSQGVSVYLDSVRINEPFGDVVNWDMLPESAISRMLLVPGSNPAYGLNTLGGALVMTTKSGLTHPGGELEMTIGSFGRKRTDLAYGKAFEDGWHAFVAGTAFSEDGWRAQSPSRLGNLYTKLGHAGDATSWDVSLLSGASHMIGNGMTPSYREIDGHMVDGLYETDRRAAYTYPDETRNRLTQVAFTMHHDIDAQTELNTSLYTRSSRRDGITGDVNQAYGDYIEACADGFDDSGAARNPDRCNYRQADGAALHTAALNASSTRQTSRGLALGLSHVLARHRIAIGLTVDNSRVAYEQTSRDAWFNADRGVVVDPTQAIELAARVTGKSSAAGLYASDTWTMLPQTWLTASARLNHVRVDNTLTNPTGPQPEESFTYNKLNPAVGFARDFGHGLNVFANISQSNRVPTVIELGCADPLHACRLPAGLQSDPYLKQVVSRTIEAGARWQASPDLSMNAAVYRTVNRDDILFFTAGASQQGYFANFDRTRHQGADFAMTRKLGSVELRASYSYLHATYDANGQIYTGLRNVNVTPGMPIAGLPRHTLKLGIDWNVGPRLVLGGDMTAISSLVTRGNEDGLIADPVAGNAPMAADWRVRGYALLNLRASYRPTPKLEMFARMNNVFDRRYENFGNLATDVFPGGQILAPHVTPQEPSQARFVAAGAPRSVVVGVRYAF